MSDKIYIGIDNGVSGTIGIVGNGEARVYFTPTKSQQDYTKKKKNVTRVDTDELHELLYPTSYKFSTAFILAGIERPMVNSQRFNAGLSAIRALEATLIVLENFRFPFEYIDSRQWQKELLPKGVTGSPALKKASMDVGLRLFPHLREGIEKHGDADGLLIAEWMRRNQL